MPILMVGISPDENTPIVEVRKSQFARIEDIKRDENKWRIVNGICNGTDISRIGPQSEVGTKIEIIDENEV